MSAINYITPLFMPVAGLVLGILLGLVSSPSRMQRSLAQFFVSGGVFAAMTIELLPRLLKAMETNNTVAVVIGFLVGVIFLFIIKAVSLTLDTSHSSQLSPEYMQLDRVAVGLDDEDDDDDEEFRGMESLRFGKHNQPTYNTYQQHYPSPVKYYRPGARNVPASPSMRSALADTAVVEGVQGSFRMALFLAAATDCVIAGCLLGAAYSLNTTGATLVALAISGDLTVLAGLFAAESRLDGVSAYYTTLLGLLLSVCVALGSSTILVCCDTLPNDAPMMLGVLSACFAGVMCLTLETMLLDPPTQSVTGLKEFERVLFTTPFAFLLGFLAMMFAAPFYA